jgi:drug/metabolite transporter (DMT)-like permease
MSPSTTRPTLFAAGSVLLWCFSGACFRRGAELLGPMPYLALITGGGALTAVVLQTLHGRALGDLWRLPKRVMVAGFFGVALYTVILAFAFSMADEKDIGQVNLLNYLWPMWLVVLGMALLGGRPRPLPALFGAALGFGGVVVSHGVDTLTRAPSSLLPHALALLGGFMWAVYSVLLRRWRIPEEKGGTAFHFAVCAAMAAAIAAADGSWQAATDWRPETVFWVAFGAIGPVGLAYHWWEIGMKRGSVHLLALLAYFTPIGSTLVIGLLFRKALSPGLLPGAVMIAVGAYLVRRAMGPNEQDTASPQADA